MKNLRILLFLSVAVLGMIATTYATRPKDKTRLTPSQWYFSQTRERRSAETDSDEESVEDILSKRMPPGAHGKQVAKRMPPGARGKQMHKNKRADAPGFESDEVNENDEDDSLEKRMPPGARGKQVAKRMPPGARGKQVAKRMPPGARGKQIAKRSLVASDEDTNDSDDSLEKRSWWDFVTWTKRMPPGARGKQVAKRMPPGARGKLINKRSPAPLFEDDVNRGGEEDDDSLEKRSWWEHVAWKRMPPGARGKQVAKRVPPGSRGKVRAVVVEKRPLFQLPSKPKIWPSGNKQIGSAAGWPVEYVPIFGLPNEGLESSFTGKSFGEDFLEGLPQKRFSVMDANGMLYNAYGGGDGGYSIGEDSLHGIHESNEPVEYKRWVTSKSQVKSEVAAGFKQGYQKNTRNKRAGLKQGYQKNRIIVKQRE